MTDETSPADKASCNSYVWQEIVLISRERVWKVYVVVFNEQIALLMVVLSVGFGVLYMKKCTSILLTRYA